MPLYAAMESSAGAARDSVATPVNIGTSKVDVTVSVTYGTCGKAPA